MQQGSTPLFLSHLFLHFLSLHASRPRPVVRTHSFPCAFLHPFEPQPVGGFAFLMCNKSVSPGRRPTRRWRLEPSKREPKNSLSVSSSHKWIKAILYNNEVTPPTPFIHFLSLVPITSWNFRQPPADKHKTHQVNQQRQNNTLQFLISWGKGKKCLTKTAARRAEERRNKRNTIWAVP